MNIKSKYYCTFCAINSKREGMGFYVCPNGHYIIKVEGDKSYIEIIQPKSEDIDCDNIFRLNNINGEFCDDVGKPISEDNKHESVDSEVS